MLDTMLLPVTKVTPPDGDSAHPGAIFFASVKPLSGPAPSPLTSRRSRSIDCWSARSEDDGAGAGSLRTPLRRRWQARVIDPATGDAGWLTVHGTHLRVAEDLARTAGCLLLRADYESLRVVSLRELPTPKSTREVRA